MNWIQNTHLKKHGITQDEYRERFPGALLKDEEMTKILSETRHKAVRKVCKLEGCDNLVSGKHNKFCSSSCAGKHRAKIGNSSIVKYGEENPAYKDGKYQYGKNAKRAAYKRDNKCCQKCGKSVASTRYGIHHIIPRRLFDDFQEADKLENLITLCSKCHKQVEADTLNLVFKLYLDGDLKTMEELVEYIKKELIYT